MTFRVDEEALDATRRAFIFGFGALTTAAAFDAINSTAIASEAFRKFLLAEAAGPSAIKSAVVYKPLVDKLNSNFNSVKAASDMGAQLRGQFGSDLLGDTSTNKPAYKFGGFVAPDKNPNKWLPGTGNEPAPGQFQQDRSRFHFRELQAFEASMRENFGTSDPNTVQPLDWPIHFSIFQEDVGDQKSHVLMVKDSTGAKRWFCITICYD